MNAIPKTKCRSADWPLTGPGDGASDLYVSERRLVVSSKGPQDCLEYVALHCFDAGFD
jgi:hypothetical protein